MRIYLNGEIIEAERASISPFDRGFLFGDGIYEAVLFFNRAGVGMTLHIARLARSMAQAGITGFDAASFPGIAQRLLEDGRLENAIVYLQVTRGVQMPRRHLPRPDMMPTVFAYALPAAALTEMREPQPVHGAIIPDERWARCDIKSTSLIGNVLAGLDGARRGAAEVILERNGFVTEGSMSNVFGVRDRTVFTPPDDCAPFILSGVMRRMLLELAESAGTTIEVRPVRVEEIRNADEVFITSSRRLLDAVTAVDGRPVGSGGVGAVARDLFARLRDRIARECSVSLHSLAS